MKCKNIPAKPPGRGRILPFVQQFSISAVLMSGMLYFVQNFSSKQLIHSPHNTTRECPQAAYSQLPGHSLVHVQGYLFMPDMLMGLQEDLLHMCIIQRVKYSLAFLTAFHNPQIAQVTELVGNSGLSHVQDRRQVMHT